MHYISNRIERVFDPASMKVTMYRSTIRMAYYDAISVGEVTLHMKIKNRSLNNRQCLGYHLGLVDKMSQSASLV